MTGESTGWWSSWGSAAIWTSSSVQKTQSIFSHFPEEEKKRENTYFFFLRASKPSPAIFELALSSASAVPSSDACHVGDDVDKDYLGARAAGFGRALLMDRSGGEGSPADGRVQEEDVCKDFLEVMEKLELPTR